MVQRPPDPNVIPEHSVTVTQQAVLMSVRWALTYGDPDEVVTVQRMLLECHHRLQQPLHWQISTLLAKAVSDMEPGPERKAWDKVVGKMGSLSLRRS